MKKFVSMLCAFLGLFMIGFTVQPSSTAQASEKTYVIDTDVTFPPFVYANEDNKYVGIDMDLIRAIAKEEGFKIKIRPVGFNAAVQSVSSGQADGVIAGMSITDERKAKFDFSDPYYSSGIVMGVKPNGDVKSLKDLKGKKVAVKTGTSGADYANSIKDKYGFKVVTFDDSDNMYNDVKNGNSAGCFEDSAGVPIVGPSANSSGKPSPTTAQHVYHDLEGRIAGILDDGPTQVGVESTIIDLSSEHPVILRPGAVTVEQLEEVLKETVLSDKHKVGMKEVPKAPGMKYKHYAPDAQVLIVKAGDWDKALLWRKNKQERVGVMAFNEVLKNADLPKKLSYSLGDTVFDASRRLFAGLRYFDSEEKVDFILCAGVKEAGLGEAYMNRLKSLPETFF